MNGIVARPKTWLELLEELYADDWHSHIRRHRSPYAFRGMSDSSWGMPTSLVRLGGDYQTLERHLLRNFRKYAHLDVVERDSFWHWLIAAQHHGLPTRLLDWTYSPFVALHFATDNIAKMETDGVVWCVDIGKIHETLPITFKTALANEGSNVFTVDMLVQYELPDVNISLFGVKVSSSTLFPTKIKNLADFERAFPAPSVLFLEPTSIDDRIVNQFSLFSVASQPAIILDKWLEQHPKTYKKIIIDKSLKWQVRDRLDQANINERVLFPGLDGLSRWLTRHYSPSKPGADPVALAPPGG